MHIAIDARMYGTKNRGIGRYLMKLVEHLEQVDSQNEYTLFLRKENFEEYQPKNPRFKKALWDAPWYGWREQLQCKIQNAKCKINLWHFPHWNVPFFFKQPFIVTIHDLELFSSNRTRENSTRGRFMYWFKFQAFKIIFRHAVLAARAIIVPSQFVKEQLLDKYPKVRRRVQVIYEAPTIEKLAASTPEARDTPNPKLLASSSYVLYVGAAYPHKNLPRLLEAWQIVQKEFPDHKLVLVGREDFFWRRLKSSAALHVPLSGGQAPALQQTTPDILFYGEASDTELAALYLNAALLVQPSLEEGFSLSPLEALSFGRPVAVSDITVHREIYGNAVRYFNPLSPDSIAEALKKTLTIPSQGSLPRTYSWLTHAKETKALYEGQKKV